MFSKLVLLFGLLVAGTAHADTKFAVDYVSGYGVFNNGVRIGMFKQSPINNSQFVITFSNGMVMPADAAESSNFISIGGGNVGHSQLRKLVSDAMACQLNGHPQAEVSVTVIDMKNGSNTSYDPSWHLVSAELKNCQ